MIKYNIGELCDGAGGKRKKSFTKQEISTFISLHEKILTLGQKEQIQELYKKWSPELFVNLLEILCFLRKSGEGITPNSHSEHPKLSPIITIVREDIFGNNSLEEIFYKFIQRKAIMSSDIDYGHSELEKSRYGNLSSEGRTAYERCLIFTNSEDILRIGNKHSPERTRRERKTALDALFTCLMKDPNMQSDPKFISTIFEAFDMALDNEKRRNIDNEYGSYHHVLYGMMNGNDDFVVDPWLNSNSQFQYLCFVVILFEILNRQRH